MIRPERCGSLYTLYDITSRHGQQQRDGGRVSRGCSRVTDWLEAKMSREDAARFQYRIRPYLSGAPRLALDARLSDIAVNLFDFMSDGRIGLWDNPARDQWLNRLAAVNVELARRGEHKLKLPQLECKRRSENPSLKRPVSPVAPE